MNCLRTKGGVVVPQQWIILAAIASAAVATLSGCGRPAEDAETQQAGVAVQSPVPAPPPTLEQREADVVENPLKQAYFGETHVHTSYSLDAFIGGTRLTPDDAYRFAKGEEVVVNGAPRAIGRPLDFAAVTDHAEYLGVMYSTQVAGAPGYDNEQLAELRGLTKPQEREAWFVRQILGKRTGVPQQPDFYAGPDTVRSAWSEVVVKAAAEHYEPGRFTTFAAFEWTAAPTGANLHRNVIFRDLRVPEMPISAIDTRDEEQLWAWMTEQQDKGSTLLAIPHNSNASKGLMFEPIDNGGDPLDAAYARERSRWEPLIEMMQVKGNSEVAASFWPADEFADFENALSVQSNSGRTFKKENFVRWGVIKGLAYQRALGENPYKLGFIGGTDSHNGTPGDVAEDAYAGSHGAADATVELRREEAIPGWLRNRDANPGTLAGVWATRNTRGAIWDAMKARETFATSGTRIRPRLFCGVGLGADPADPVALVRDGYVAGVPMGGTLSRAQSAPTCTVHALKDPDGANLDRIQIVKGWVDENGEPREKIVDVAWSGERKPDAEGRLPAVGNTVDPAAANYSNSIGSAELMGSWTDTDFDPAQPALYYARVLEIPTPRWTTYDAVRSGLPLLEDVPATIQERAWTSPVWYSP